MGKTKQQHYVEFLSPGTFFSESSRRPIDKWDKAQAVELSNGITERYNARPYGFRFVTMLEADPIPDGQGGTLDVQPREIAKSGMHYLGGTLLRYDEIPETRETNILRSNMRGNGHPVVIENCNSYRHTTFFEEGDCIVDADGSVRQRGDAPELVEYRAKARAEFKAYYERLTAE